MDRRTSVKGILIVVVSSLSTLSIWKWLKTATAPDINYLHQKKSLIAELAEIIIPKTDTPGAKDAKVEDFIIDMVWHCFDNDAQRNFMAGLDKTDQYCLDKYGHSFLECKFDEKLDVVNHFENMSISSYALTSKIRDKLLGKPFIAMFKELTVEGYCTSQSGATFGLRYDFVPGRFEPCVPIDRNQNSWATK